ncbi:DUF4412 domain-containing protein [Maribacter sp.]|nr:DUF4412 domain-containing protein [Maribacter sp.]
MKKIILLLLLLFGCTAVTNAQFFKKLGKKVEKAAEKAVERKAEQKTTKETEKAFDSTFNKKRKKRKNGSTPSVSKVAPATSYAFNYKAAMQIVNGKEVLYADYFLPTSGSYFGMALQDKKIKDEFMMVYDIDREAMFTYMTNNGQKMKMGVAFTSDDATEEAPVFDIKATGNTKIIIGYKCQEYKITGENMTATVWVTKDVEIRFPSTFHNTKKNKSDNQEWMKDLDGWAMEMEMIETAKKKPQTIIMKCLSIEESSLQVNSVEYQNLGGY